MSAIAAHYLGRPATPPIALSLETAWEVLGDPRAAGRGDREALAHRAARARGRRGGRRRGRHRGAARARARAAAPAHRDRRHALAPRRRLLARAPRAAHPGPPEPPRRADRGERDHRRRAPHRARRAPRGGASASSLRAITRRAARASRSIPAPLALGSPSRARVAGARRRGRTQSSASPRCARRGHAEVARAEARDALRPRAAPASRSSSRSRAPSASGTPSATNAVVAARQLHAAGAHAPALRHLAPRRRVGRGARRARGAAPRRPTRATRAPPASCARWCSRRSASSARAAGSRGRRSRASCRSDQRIPGIARLLRRWAERVGARAGRADGGRAAHRAREPAGARHPRSRRGRGPAARPGGRRRRAPASRCASRRAAARCSPTRRPPADGDARRSSSTPTSCASAPQARVGAVLAIAPFVEVGRAAETLDLIVAPQTLARALSAGLEADVLRARIEAHRAAARDALAHAGAGERRRRARDLRAGGGLPLGRRRATCASCSARGARRRSSSSIRRRRAACSSRRASTSSASRAAAAPSASRSSSRARSCARARCRRRRRRRAPSKSGATVKATRRGARRRRRSRPAGVALPAAAGRFRAGSVSDRFDKACRASATARMGAPTGRRPIIALAGCAGAGRTDRWRSRLGSLRPLDELLGAPPTAVSPTPTAVAVRHRGFSSGPGCCCARRGYSRRPRFLVRRAACSRVRRLRFLLRRARTLRSADRGFSLRREPRLRCRRTAVSRSAGRSVLGAPAGRRRRARGRVRATKRRLEDALRVCERHDASAAIPRRHARAIRERCPISTNNKAISGHPHPSVHQDRRRDRAVPHGGGRPRGQDACTSRQARRARDSSRRRISRPRRTWTPRASTSPPGSRRATPRTRRRRGLVPDAAEAHSRPPTARRARSRLRRVPA